LRRIFAIRYSSKRCAHEGGAKQFSNYRWALAVLREWLCVLGTFIFYAVDRHSKDTETKSSRQVFRGLAFIGQDISENLGTLKPIFKNFDPQSPSIYSKPGMTPDEAKDAFRNDKLNDLNKTPRYQHLRSKTTA